MKKYLKALFIAVFAISVLYAAKSIDVNAQEIDYPVPYTGIVMDSTPNGIFIYTAADDKSQPMPVMAQYGWIVDVVASDGDYSKICFYNGNVNNRAYGYVKTSSLFITPTPLNENFETIYGYTGLVAYDNVDVRSTTNLKDVFQILPKYSRVTIIAKSANWYKVQTNVGGVVKTGYIYKGLLKAEDALFSRVSLVYTKNLVRNKSYKITVKDLSPVALSKKVTFKTSNKKIVSISSTGTFKIKKPGKATITVQVKCGTRTRTFNLKLKTFCSYKFSK